MIDLGNASYGPRSFHRTYLKKSLIKTRPHPLLLDMGELLFFVPGDHKVGCVRVCDADSCHRQSEVWGVILDFNWD